MHSELDSTSTDIYTMPLVQVSIDHGTEGLEQRLQHALTRVGLADSELVQASIRLGMELHADDSRTYEPYENHLLRVALRLVEDFEVTDPAIIAAALLHDSLEDHSEELARLMEVDIPDDTQKIRKLGYKALSQVIQRDVATLVSDVSNPILLPGQDKMEEYHKHIEELVSDKSIAALLVKFADFIDNAVVPEGIEDPDKRRYLDRKQLSLYALFADRLERLKNVVSDEAQGRIVDVLSSGKRSAIRRLNK